MPRGVRADEPVTATLSELPVEIDLGRDDRVTAFLMEDIHEHVIMGACA